jgi:hypothetical protein
MPWFDEKGLFPGLAMGLGIPMPWFEENGLFPGRGMPCNGVGLSAGFSAGFSAGSAGLASGSAFLASGFGFSAFGFSAGFSFLGKAARSLAATGGAMVEDPPFTYSPSSSSFARATLVSMPSSLATSYTRGSATEFLLSGANPKQGRPYC